MRIRKISVLCLILIMGTGLFASSLTLEQALDAARGSNSTIKVATLTLQQALREGETNTYLPSISLDLGVKTVGSIANNSIDTTYSVGGISFSLDSSNSYTRKQLALSSITAQNTYQSTLNTVEANVTTAYWNVVAAQLAETSEQATVEKEQRYYDQAQKRYEAGLTTQLAVNEAKLALYDSQLTLQEAQITTEKSIDSLNLLLGKSDTWEMDDLPTLKTVQALDALTALTMKTTTVKTLDLAVQQAKLNLASEKSTALSPTLSVSASTGLSGSISSSGVTFADATSISVGVSVPLDAYLKNSSSQVSLDSKKYGVEIAQAEYESGVTSLKAKVKTAYTALQQALSTLKKLKEHNALAKEQLVLVQQSYEAGLSTFSDLQDSLTEVQSSNIAIVQQNLEYTLSLYDLSYLLEVDSSVITITN
ncbi:TolC family protein [uncultured Sphaerochaeta sp.]|uniref:TolC family protein n=1 Tax=uncultured Sphaerochaeta sp. TaxID=886478 RepID=UPI002A0A9BFC|nr:TolC family protein [uncultured Sphaerochaeta sp.]